MGQQNDLTISKGKNSYSKFEEVFIKIAWFLAISVFLLAATRFIEIFYQIYKSNYNNTSRIVSQDSTINHSSLNYKIDYLEKEILQTRTEIKEISEKTIAVSRDLIAFITLIIGILSVATVYRIISIRKETTDLLNEAKDFVGERDNTIKELRKEIDSIGEYKQYFDHAFALRNSNLDQLKTAINYFMANEQKFYNDFLIITGLEYAHKKNKSHEIKALILRAMATLGAFKAIHDLKDRIKDNKIDGNDKKYYKIALKGLNELHNPEIELILSKEKLKNLLD
ncbi:MAG: hypothetical protein JW956_05690 [Calditrichaceae bacterium]|nr:hypothetical protein [Calditrichaceae bacterium]